MKADSIRKCCSIAVAGLVFVAVVAPASAWASHFRGGSITWQSKALDGDGIKNDVEITVKTAWRYNQINLPSLQKTPSFTTTQKSNDIIYVNGDSTSAEYALQTTIFSAKDLDLNTGYRVSFSSGNRIGGLKNNANGYWDIQTNINLKDDNLAPKIDLPIILEVPQYEADGTTPLASWTYDLSSTDPNADKLRYRLANLAELGGGSSTNPAGLAINPNTGVITWSGSGSMASGMYSGGIVAEDVDETGNAKSKTHVDLILSLVPQAQVVYTNSGSIPETRNVTVEKGDSFSFNISGSAIDTQSLGTMQGALTEDSADYYTFTPGPVGSGLDPGSYPITFEIRDSTNARSNNYLGLTFIVPDPNAPRISDLEADKATYSGTEAVLVDEGSDAVVTDANTTDFQGGMLKLNVTFTDGQLEVLGVESAGTGAGQISRSGDDIFYEGIAFATVSPSLNGAGRALRIDFTGPTSIDALQALVRSLNYRDTFALRAAGDRSLSLYVKDPEGHSTSNDFFVHVEAHPQQPDPTVQAPPVEAANEITLVEGDAIALSNENISFADPNGDAITFAVTVVTNGHFALVSNQAAAISSFTQDDINLGKIAFVHDGSEIAPTYELTATDTITSPVASMGTVNFTNVSDYAPSFTNSPATTVAEGAVYSYVPTINDADIGETYTYSITNRPDWATFDSHTGTLAGSPGFNDSGIYSGISISVTDGTSSATLPAFAISVTNINRGPSISGTPVTSVAEGSAYSFIPTGTDPDTDDTLAYTVSGNPSWLDMNGTTGELSGKPGFADAGTYANIVVTVVDGKGGSATSPAFAIEVTNSNREPSIAGVPVTTVAEDANYSFTPNGSDPDTDDTLSYSISGNPAWLSINGTTGVLSGKPGFADAGTYSNIVVTVADGKGGTASLPAFGIEVTNSNREPSITGTPVTTVAEDADYSFTPNASDPDTDDTLSYSISGNPAWLSINSTTGELSGKPGFADAGTYANIVVTVVDGKGGSATLPAFAIEVTNSNREPSIAGVPVTTVAEDANYSFIPNGTDLDTDDTLAYSVSGNPAWLSINSTTGELSGKPGFADADTYANIVVTVVDGKGGSATLPAFAIEVTNSNREPSIAGTPVTTVAEDADYGFNAIGTDPDTDDTLSYSISGNPAWLSINGATGVLSGKPGFADAGTYANIVVTVADGKGGSATLPAFAIEVTNSNRDPSLAGVPVTTGAEDANYSFTPNGSDPDTDDTLAYSVSGNPAWLNINGTTGELTGKPGFTEAGTYSNIVVTVADGNGGTASLPAFAIEVRNINRAPEADEQSVNVVKNISRSITLTGTDSDGDALDYAVVDEPQNGVLEGVAPDVVFIPAEDFVGNDSFTFKLTDAFGDESGVVTVLLNVLADSDNDGLPDEDDPDNGNTDADGDGIPDGADVDVDGDGVKDNGTDSDDDGVNDESDVDNTGGTDTDGDGIDDDRDTVDNNTDSDGDGLPDDTDPNSGNTDTDGDGIPDGADVDVDGDGVDDNGTDSDSDGINDESDVDTSGGSDSDGDGINDDHDTVDDSTDSDGDGLPDDTDPDNGNTDTDGDGIPDGVDVDVDGDGVNDNGTDADGDGINDLAEGKGDTDDDGVPNYLDTDSDGDGIPDADEGAADADNDGIADYRDTDSDNDGISDADEGTADADADGVADYRDSDSDNDGIPDADEGVADADNDGIADYLDTDSDNDGISDADEGVADADSDGIADYLDTDSDNDGTSDNDEGAGDVDGDGTPDYLDTSLDEDGDGVLDIIEGTGDEDNDGIPSYLDTDSDNDGIPDVLEARLSVALTGTDSDKNGIDDAIDVNFTGGSDSNGNGIDDAHEPVDTDADGIADYKDVDSDNDRLPDRIEAAMVMLVDVDGDGDGIDDFLDVDQTGGADLNGDGVDDEFAPRDTDKNGVPDHLSLDSDGDGILDQVESGASGVDSDRDGIDDSYDVDTTLGVDANGDGIDDAVTARDSDGDGAPDYMDLDSDNDAIGDVLEAGLKDLNRDGLADDGITTASPLDTDADGNADYLDLDSDGDGQNDIDSAGFGLLDGDGDGRIDVVTDIDGDGVPDVNDNEVGRFGGSLDTDLDGIPNSLDLDDDNDGIPDAIENAAVPVLSGEDSDGDGIDDAVDASITGGRDINGDGIDDALDGDTDDDGVPDSLDLDSDNDGIPDVLEYGLASVADADHNGRVDYFVDSNGDGLHDAVDANRAAVDSDADGAPDFQDIDSDGDEVTDFVESGTFKTLDTNNDGRIDAFVDTDRDGLADVVDGEVAGSAGIVPAVPDSDGDGEPDYRDADSDNDGFTDDLENGDFDGDGVSDSQQNSGELKTAVKGGGSVGFSFLGMLLGLLVWRRFNRAHAAARPHFAAFALGLTLLAAAHQANAEEKPACGSNVDGNRGAHYQSCWFVGAGAGLSHLDPEGQTNGWSTDDSSSTGFEVHLGQRFSRHWFWELRYTDMGEAALGNINPALDQLISDAAVSYEIPSLMAGYVLWDKPYGFNLYAKAGVSAISTWANDSRIGLQRQTSTQLALGAGVQYGFKHSPWFVRLEFDSYDRDANIVGLSLSRYFGGGDDGRSSARKPLENAPTQRPVSPAGTDAGQREAVPSAKPEPVVSDTDSDGVQDDRDECSPTQPGAVVNDAGCPLFDGVSQSVNFRSDEARLTAQAKAILDDVADDLAGFPDVVLEVQAHTDNQGSDGYNMALSEQRAAAVIGYLASKGVDASRLKAKGYGESQPIASNETPSGRASNRRVVFVVLK